MPKIIIQTDPASHASARVTLSERVVASNLVSPHYVAQLIERLAWATSDAESLESVRPAQRPPALKVLDAEVQAVDALVDAR
jgi:hypothetical protein